MVQMYLPTQWEECLNISMLPAQNGDVMPATAQLISKLDEHSRSTVCLVCRSAEYGDPHRSSVRVKRLGPDVASVNKIPATVNARWVDSPDCNVDGVVTRRP